MTKVSDKQLIKNRGLIKNSQVRLSSTLTPIELIPLVVESRDNNGVYKKVDNTVIDSNSGIYLGQHLDKESRLSFKPTLMPKIEFTSLRLNIAVMVVPPEVDSTLGIRFCYLDKNFKYEINESDIINITKYRKCRLDIPVANIEFRRPFCSSLQILTNKRIIIQSVWLEPEGMYGDK